MDVARHLKQAVILAAIALAARLLSPCALGQTDNPPAAQPAEPAAAVAKLVVYPADIRLDSRNDLQLVLVVATDNAGVTREVGKQAVFSFNPPGIAERDERGRVVARKSGQTVLTVEFNAAKCDVPITVVNAANERPISFRNDIEPVLMKAGCNTGSCHGNARGQEGFRLSLFGFDPSMDYINLTRQAGARRMDVAAPADSLMLHKVVAGVTHGGGQRFDSSDALYVVLTDWIKSGAGNDPPQVERLSGVRMTPEQIVLTAGGSTHPLLVQAAYSNHTDRDVTGLAVFSSLNDASATVTPDGLVTAKVPGEVFIMSRFGTFAVVTQVIVVPDRPFAWPADVKPFNNVDKAVHAKLRKMRILPAPVCDDNVFIRRAYLDMLGVLPTPAEYERFAADKQPDRRAALIDELLERPEFPELWAMKWAELLQIESTRLSVKGVQLYNAWLRDAIFRDVPLDQIARELLTAEGGNYHNPPANFFLIESNPTTMAENVAQVFTGIRIQCAQCHNHPFERWTMDDYYSFAAFFSQIGRKGSEDPRETIIYNSGSGEVKHIVGGRTMPPKFLGGATPKIPAGVDRRKVFAEWLTSPDNEWFAECIVNRVWAHFFGRGIIDPPDDVRVSNPPSHPALLEQLGKKLVGSGYDLRGLVREICNSRTYQLSTATNDTNAGDVRNFSHAVIRRLPAEQLLDAICQVTEVREKFAGLPLGSRAVQVAGARTGSYFLDVFGRPKRQSACTCERRSEPTLSQALHLINGPTISAKIKAGGGRLDRLFKSEQPPEAIIRELYIASLSRPPSDEELAAARKFISEAPNPRSGLEDIFWAVLNSQEFVFNH